MLYFTELLINGAVAGLLYALVALAFVVVYKASKVVNFALGELVMFATGFVAAGLYVLGLGLAGAILLGCVGMAAVSIGFNYVVMRHLIARPLVTYIMVTIGFGALLRAVAAFVFAGVPRTIELPLPTEPFLFLGLLLSPHELASAAIALGLIVVLTWFFTKSRTGIALRCIADDQQASMAMGINLQWHFALTWGLAGAIAVAGGVLWTFVTGGGFSMVLVGLKVLPIVIIGGLESIPGVILGAMLIGVLESLAAGYIGAGMSSVTAFVVLIAVLLMRPEGLLGSREIQRV